MTKTATAARISFPHALLARRPRHLSISLLACLAVLFSVIGQPVEVSASPRVPQDSSTGYTTLDKYGCPIYHGPGGGSPIAAFGDGGPTTTFLGGDEHCVPLPASVFTLTRSADGGCAALTIVQVADPEAVSRIAAVVYSTIGLGTRWWEQPENSITGTGGGTGAGQTTGFGGITYQVPDGDYAWQVGGGGGACPAGSPKLDGWAAWGITYKWLVSGHVTYSYTGQPAVGVTVNADCPTGGSKTTDNNGYYWFLLDKGPCTIAPVPPAGLEVDPEKRVLDVESNISDVDFQLSATLYFAVKSGLSVKSNSTLGAGLIKAGTAFTEQVTLKDISKKKTVVVAPIYPTLSGNANGGALQPVGGIVQKQITSLSSANPSPIVVLRPGQEQVFDSVIFTDASSSLGTNDGGKKVSGGTRAYVQFSVPNAFVLKAGDDLQPLDPHQIVVENGSTDKIAVSIDDSAPDQMPFNGYLATWDISKGLVLGLYHFTVGLEEGIASTLELIGKAVVNVPTAVMNYVNAEAQLWQAVKDNPVEAALFTNIVTNQMLLVYKQAPFLLKQLGDFKAAVDDAVYQHFNKIEQDWRQGDWEAALTAWADDGANLSANLLILNPSLMAGAIGDATIARVPGVIEDFDAADAAAFAKNDEEVAKTLGTGESEGEIADSVAADEELAEGNELTPAQQANIFGVSPEEFASMVETAKGNPAEGIPPTLITLRSRASEAISLVQKGLSYVKPAAIKLKTISAIDIKYLGYPADITLQGQEVSTIGQVLIKEPLYLSADCPAACALQKLQADILSKPGITQGSPEYYEIQSRWAQRYGEWINKNSGYVGNLENAAKDKSLTLDWHWQENHISTDLPQSAQTVAFRLTPGPGGTSIPEVNVAGTWKSITGDIDLVSVTGIDNSALSDDQYVRVLEELGAGPVNIQHPATATWYKDVNDDTFIFDPNNDDFADKAKYMQADKCCLMQVGPDGKARAVRFQLDGSQFVDKNDYIINYVGGYAAPAPGVPALP